MEERGEELEEDADILYWKKEDVEAALEAKHQYSLFDIQLLKNMMMMYDELDRRMTLIERGIDKKSKKGEELDKEKLKTLISEYRKLKMRNVKHFRFNENATSNMFGRYF